MSIKLKIQTQNRFEFDFTLSTFFIFVFIKIEYQREADKNSTAILLPTWILDKIIKNNVIAWVALYMFQIKQSLFSNESHVLDNKFETRLKKGCQKIDPKI